MVIDSIYFVVLQIGVLPFWGWLAVRVIEQGRKLVELEQRMTAQEKHCGERLVWMRSMESVLVQVSEDTLTIRTKLGEPPHG